MREIPGRFEVLTLLVVVLVWPTVSFCQKPSNSIPPALMQCEPDSCGTWTFNGTTGEGRWDNGTIAHLTVKEFGSETLAIHRVDDKGVGAGIDGWYVGTRKGDHIEGTFTWTWPGHPGGSVNWIAILDWKRDESEPSLPNALSMCEVAPDGCSTWLFQGDQGQAQWPNGVQSRLSLAHFGSRTILIRRIDASIGLMALYIGSRKGNHIEGTVTWLWPGNVTPTGTTTWHADAGVAIANNGTASGQAGSGPVVNSSPQVTVSQTHVPPGYELQRTEFLKKTFLDNGCTIEVPPAQNMSAFEMFVKGRLTERDGTNESTDVEALKWYCEAANAGSAQAAFEIGRLYFTGFILPNIHINNTITSNTVPADMARAIVWYRRAADGRNSSGIVKLAFFYRPGIKNNPEHEDAGKFMTMIEDAANAGDTQAMAILVDGYTLGISDSLNPVAPNPPKAAKWYKAEKESLAKTQDDCNSQLGAIIAQAPPEHLKTPDYIVGGWEQDHSYYCVAKFEPDPDANSGLSGLASVVAGTASLFQGGQMTEWLYTMYWQSDRNNLTVVRNAAREEFERHIIDGSTQAEQLLRIVKQK